MAHTFCYGTLLFRLLNGVRLDIFDMDIHHAFLTAMLNFKFELITLELLLRRQKSLRIYLSTLIIASSSYQTVAIKIIKSSNKWTNMCKLQPAF